MNFMDVEDKLKEKLLLFNEHGNNEQFLLMDLLMKMLNLKPELRPSVEKVLHHPLFWTDKKCFEFIFEIQKIDCNNIAEFWQMPVVSSLQGTLDTDKSVVHNDWISKLDATLEQEFNRGYDKESVSALLRAMRKKVIILLSPFLLFIH